jgi:hypothetical protein
MIDARVLRNFTNSDTFVQLPNGPLDRASRGYIPLQQVYESGKIIQRVGIRTTWKKRIAVLP